MVYYPRPKAHKEIGKKLKYRLRKLSMHKKLVGIGSILAIIGIFLPWSSLDTTNVSNALHGMTFLVGYIILLLAIFCFVIFFFHFLEKKPPRLPLKEHTLNIFVGLEIILLCIIVISIFKSLFLFKVNSDIGMGVLLTTIGGFLVFIGGYIAWKEEREENVKKTFMHLPDQKADDNDLERFLRKSKEQRKTLTAEEEIIREEKKDDDSANTQPPNLQMFE